MFEVELEDGLMVTVDHSTAIKLQDASYARQYLEMVKDAVRKDSTKETTSESSLWKIKHGTAIDHDATLAYLSLRKTYDEKFRDKKTCKNTLWAKIRDQLNEMGYFVGEGVAGREKCRQKFANLQSSYLRTKEKRRRTGEGKVQDCPYFREIDAILGDKHKTEPVLVLDSLNMGPSTCVQASSSTSTSGQQSQSESIDDEETYKNVTSTCSKASSTPPRSMEHRFTNIKSTVRPLTPRNKALEDLVSIQRENQAARKDEFKAMMETFMQQSKRQHEETMALIAAMSSTAKKQKTDGTD